MKPGKTGDPVTTSYPDEASASTATEALRQGNERPVGHYTRALREALKRLAYQFAPFDEGEAQWQFLGHRPRKQRSPGTKQSRPVEATEEWEGTLDQICEAIENGKARSIGLYLREAAGVLSHLAESLDPPQDSKGWRLEFVRKGRGRRRDDSVSSMFEESRRARELWEETRKAGGQQESAIAALKGKTGRSRSSLFRAKQKTKRGTESHKKR